MGRPSQYGRHLQGCSFRGGGISSPAPDAGCQRSGVLNQTALDGPPPTPRRQPSRCHRCAQGHLDDDLLQLLALHPGLRIPGRFGTRCECLSVPEVQEVHFPVAPDQHGAGLPLPRRPDLPLVAGPESWRAGSQVENLPSNTIRSTARLCWTDQCASNNWQCGDSHQHSSCGYCTNKTKNTYDPRSGICHSRRILCSDKTRFAWKSSSKEQ